MKLKNFILFFITILSLGYISQAQTQSPCDANPFCSDSSYDFPNVTGGVTAISGPDYGCLGSEPNAVWYYMQIGIAGTIQLSINQTSASGTGLDVDFAMWGPFTDLATGCASVLGGASPLQCSYSASASETIGLGLPGGVGSGATTPPSAQVGEVYIVVLTNYSQQAGNITFAQTSGTGAADCGIVCGLTAQNSGPVCLGNTVTLSAVTTDTVNSFTYYWTGPNGFNAIGQNVNVTPSSAGTFTYTVLSVATNSTGGNDTCVATTDVVINPTYNDTVYQSICSGQSYVYLGDTFTQSGAYKDTLTSVYGCDSVVTLSLTVNPLPNVALTVPRNIICKGSFIPISVTNPSFATGYQWYKDGNPVPGGTSSYDAAAAANYFVIGTTANGCIDTSEVVPMTVDTVSVNFDYSLLKGCSGDTVVFTNLSDTGTYIWHFGDNSPVDSINMNPQHFYQIQNQYSVKLIAKDTLSCVDSFSKVIDTRHPFNAVFGQTQDSVCQTGSAAVLFIDQSIGNIESWHWNFGDGGSDTSQNANHIFTQSGTYTISLVIQEVGLPCTDTAYGVIYVDSAPFAKLIINPDTICNGDKANFSIDYLQTATNFHWNFGDNSTLSGSMYNSVTHSYDNAGFYTPTVTLDYPVCPSITAKDTILVLPYPIVNLPKDTSLCLNGSPFTINNTAAYDPLTKWAWSTGDSTSSIQIVNPGTYSVTANLNGCTTTDFMTVHKDCYADIPNAFTPNSDGVNDYFFPRQFLSKGVTSFKLTVYNRWGQVIFETTNTNGRGWDGKFNGKNQPEGVYVYIVDIQYKNQAAEHYEGNITLLR